MVVEYVYQNQLSMFASIKKISSGLHKRESNIRDEIGVDTVTSVCLQYAIVSRLSAARWAPLYNIGWQIGIKNVIHMPICSYIVHPVYF